MASRRAGMLKDNKYPSTADLKEFGTCKGRWLGSE